jgi:hypothetical protein
MFTMTRGVRGSPTIKPTLYQKSFSANTHAIATSWSVPNEYLSAELTPTRAHGGAVLAG